MLIQRLMACQGLRLVFTTIVVFVITGLYPDFRAETFGALFVVVVRQLISAGNPGTARKS